MSKLIKTSVCLAVALCFLASVLFIRKTSKPEPLAIGFLHYTNNEARVRIALMEITNRTDAAYRWTLRSDAKPGSLIWITDLVETNGELRGVGISGGVNTFGHDALQFGTDDFKAGKQLWAEVEHYPKTRGEQFREKLSDLLGRCGLLRAALYVREGRRINGPELPPDRLL